MVGKRQTDPHNNFKIESFQYEGGSRESRNGGSEKLKGAGKVQQHRTQNKASMVSTVKVGYNKTKHMQAERLKNSEKPQSN